MTSATLKVHRAAVTRCSSTQEIVLKASDELLNSLLMLSPVLVILGLMLCCSRVDAVILRTFAGVMVGVAAIISVRYFAPKND